MDRKRAHYLQNRTSDDVYSPYTPRKSLSTPGEVRVYFESIKGRLLIAGDADWYRISRAQIVNLGGSGLLWKFGDIGHALQFAYPEIEWDLSKFSHRGKKSGQRWLSVKVKQLLPGVDIVEDYQHPELMFELDLWIPQHRIGIEYQGEHHYLAIDAFGPNGSTECSERDSLKIQECSMREISLIVIPFWWNGEEKSLSATLYQARPDVFPATNATPIPFEMTERAFSKKKKTKENSPQIFME